MNKTWIPRCRWRGSTTSISTSRTPEVRSTSSSRELALEARGRFDRGGGTLRARAEQTKRGTWEPWGDTAPLSPALGSPLVDFDPEDRQYRHYRGQVSKQIILPYFQKVILQGQYL